VPAGTPHRTRSHGARLVRMEFPDAALALARVRPQPTMFTHPRTISLARRVADEVRSRDHGWQLVVHGLLLELLGHVAREQSAPSGCRAPTWLRDVKDRLDSEWRQAISLSELASAAGVHPVHLARSFRACYGSSVGEYRRARQLEAAEERLRRSDEDLRQVALSCGFADQSHFSKAFSRAFGVSPGRYRRTALGRQ